MVGKVKTSAQFPKEMSPQVSPNEDVAKADNPFQAFIVNIPKKYRRAFTLAAVGLLAVYAIWVSIPDSLRESILLSLFRSDPVKTYAFDGAQILDQNVILDLSNWQEVRDNMRTTIPASPAIWKYRIRARKVQPTNYFYHENFTSGLPPYAVCLTHPFTYEEVPYTPNPGRENLRKFLLTVDISNVDVNKEFEVEFLIVFWNAFQNPTREWAAQLIKYSTDNVTFTVRLPNYKPFKTFNVESYSKRDAAIGAYEGQMPVKVSDTEVQWNIQRPKAFFSYRLVWTW